jgi:hypothetical protein
VGTPQRARVPAALPPRSGAGGAAPSSRSGRTRERRRSAPPSPARRGSPSRGPLRHVIVDRVLAEHDPGNQDDAMSVPCAHQTPRVYGHGANSRARSCEQFPLRSAMGRTVARGRKKRTGLGRTAAAGPRRKTATGRCSRGSCQEVWTHRHARQPLQLLTRQRIAVHRFSHGHDLAAETPSLGQALSLRAPNSRYW